MHSALYCPDDAIRRIQVRGYVGLSILSLFHGGFQLVDRITVPGDGVGWTGNSAVCHHLDEGRSLPQFLAAGAAHFVYAIGDTAQSAEVASPSSWVEGVVAGADVGVTT